MPIYELRTYTLYVGKTHEASIIYEKFGLPWINKYKNNLVNYFIGDLGAMNQIIHIWKFADDKNRRKIWDEIFTDSDFLIFASKFRPLVLKQENKLMTIAPWIKH